MHSMSIQPATMSHPEISNRPDPDESVNPSFVESTSGGSVDPEEFSENFAGLVPKPEPSEVMRPVPVWVLETAPKDRPIMNVQLDCARITPLVPIMRATVRACVTDRGFTEDAKGREVTDDEIDVVMHCITELLANAQRDDNPKVTRKANGVYVWLDWLQTEELVETEDGQEPQSVDVPILLVGAGDNEPKAVVDDGRDHGSPESALNGHGLEMVRGLAHAVLVRPVPLESAAEREPELRTQKVYQAVIVLGSAALSREQNIALAESYVESLSLAV